MRRTHLQYPNYFIEKKGASYGRRRCTQMSLRTRDVAMEGQTKLYIMSKELFRRYCQNWVMGRISSRTSHRPGMLFILTSTRPRADQACGCIFQGQPRNSSMMRRGQMTTLTQNEMATNTSFSQGGEMVAMICTCFEDPYKMLSKLPIA